MIIGTRQSPLAKHQTGMVIQALSQHGVKAEVLALSSRGDEDTSQPMWRIGGKGVFTSSIEKAILAGRCDIGVHSAKDLDSNGNPELEIAAVLPRGPVEDVLVSASGCAFSMLPAGATIGTASIRREFQAGALRPDLSFSLLRGRVETRLAKVYSGTFDATILSMAGISRLGLSLSGVRSLDILDFMPAGGQGIIAIQASTTASSGLRTLLGEINDPPTYEEFLSERAFLKRLEGSCRSPVGVLARVGRGGIMLRACAFLRDSRKRLDLTAEGEDAEVLGVKLAEEMLQKAKRSGEPLAGTEALS